MAADLNRAQLITNRQRFVNRLSEMEMNLRAMARVSRYPKSVCQLFEDEADNLTKLIKSVKEHADEFV